MNASPQEEFRPQSAVQISTLGEESFLITFMSAYVLPLYQALTLSLFLFLVVVNIIWWMVMLAAISLGGFISV